MATQNQKSHQNLESYRDQLYSQILQTSSALEEFIKTTFNEKQREPQVKALEEKVNEAKKELKEKTDASTKLQEEINLTTGTLSSLKEQEKQKLKDLEPLKKEQETLEKDIETCKSTINIITKRLEEALTLNKQDTILQYNNHLNSFEEKLKSKQIALEQIITATEELKANQQQQGQLQASHRTQEVEKAKIEKELKDKQLNLDNANTELQKLKNLALFPASEEVLKTLEEEKKKISDQMQIKFSRDQHQLRLKLLEIQQATIEACKKAGASEAILTQLELLHQLRLAYVNAYQYLGVAELFKIAGQKGYSFESTSKITTEDLKKIEADLKKENETTDYKDNGILKTSTASGQLTVTVYSHNLKDLFEALSRLQTKGSTSFKMDSNLHPNVRHKLAEEALRRGFTHVDLKPSDTKEQKAFEKDTEGQILQKFFDINKSEKNKFIAKHGKDSIFNQQYSLKGLYQALEVASVTIKGSFVDETHSGEELQKRLIKIITPQQIAHILNDLEKPANDNAEVNRNKASRDRLLNQLSQFLSGKSNAERRPYLENLSPQNLVSLLDKFIQEDKSCLKTLNEVLTPNQVAQVINDLETPTTDEMKDNLNAQLKNNFLDKLLQMLFTNPAIRDTYLEQLSEPNQQFLLKGLINKYETRESSRTQFASWFNENTLKGELEKIMKSNLIGANDLTDISFKDNSRVKRHLDEILNRQINHNLDEAAREADRPDDNVDDLINNAIGAGLGHGM